jgi:histidinol-phosphate aminotransferase
LELHLAATRDEGHSVQRARLRVAAKHKTYCMNTIEHLRANIRAMAGYVPGEQPQGRSFIKLNTNENPYPPSPRVLEALQAALTGDRLRKYPDPMGTAFRQSAGRVLGIDPESILIGNGSDDILTIVTRSFVPEGGLVVSPTPSYILYRSLAEIQGARFEQVPYTADWRLSEPWPVRGADLTFIANPNSPSGTCIPAADLARLADTLEGPLIVDEAYVDFADRHCLHLARRPKVVVTRSLSKSYALAGMRFGYAVAEPALIREFIKVKDSYNCDALSLEAARAALEDQEYLQATRSKILTTRTRLTEALGNLGFEVTPSQANFVWCPRGDRVVKPVYEELKRRMILVRYMVYEGYGDGLRITVGTDEEVDQLVEQLRKLI